MLYSENIGRGGNFLLPINVRSKSTTTLMEMLIPFGFTFSKTPMYLFIIIVLYWIHCPVSNNSFGSFWFCMVLVGHGFINHLVSESFVVSFS